MRQIYQGKKNLSTNAINYTNESQLFYINIDG